MLAVAWLGVFVASDLRRVRAFARLRETTREAHEVCVETCELRDQVERTGERIASAFAQAEKVFKSTVRGRKDGLEHLFGNRGERRESLGFRAVVYSKQPVDLSYGVMRVEIERVGKPKYFPISPDLTTDELMRITRSSVSFKHLSELMAASGLAIERVESTGVYGLRLFSDSRRERRHSVALDP